MKLRLGILHLAALAALVTLAAGGATALALAPRGAGAKSSAAIWNRFVVTTVKETDAVLLLQQSYVSRHPDRVRDESRRHLLDEAIALAAERARLLEELREAEFGDGRR